MYKGRFSTDYILHQSLAMRTHGVRRKHVDETEAMVVTVCERLIDAANKDEIDELPKQSITMSPQAMLFLMKLAGAGMGVYAESLDETVAKVDPAALPEIAEALRVELEKKGVGPNNWITS